MEKNLLLVFVLVFSAACATTGKVTGGPDWTMKGSGAFSGGGEKVFYGVGLAGPGIKDESLRREASDNRARADLQKVFDTYVGSLMKDYSGTEGELVDRVVKTYQHGSLSGVQIMDRYQRADGTLYSLAKVDLDQFKKFIELQKELNTEAREFLKKKSDAMFEELAKEEKQH